MSCSQEAADPSNKALLSLLQELEASRLQQGLPFTAGLPRLRLMGGGSRAVSSESLPAQ